MWPMLWISLVLLVLNVPARAQSSGDEFNSNSNSDPTVVYQLKQIDLITKNRNCVLDCENSGGDLQARRACAEKCEADYQKARNDLQKWFNQADAERQKARLIQQERSGTGDGNSVSQTVPSPASSMTPFHGVPLVPKLAPVGGLTPGKALTGHVAKSVAVNPPAPAPATPKNAPVSNPIPARIAKNTVPTHMYDPVPPKFSPLEIPRGFYVAKARDDTGYLRPIEACIPDPASDLTIAGTAAGAARGLCGSIIDGLVPKTGIPALPPNEEMVWVNQASRYGSQIIWRQGTRWAGNTVNGEWMTLSKALKIGARLPKPNPTGQPW